MSIFVKTLLLTEIYFDNIIKKIKKGLIEIFKLIIFFMIFFVVRKILIKILSKKLEKIISEK